MTDREKVYRTIFVRHYSTSIEGVESNKLRIADLDKFIGRKLVAVEGTGSELCLVFEPESKEK